MALPMGREDRNSTGYLFCSLLALHVQKTKKEAQDNEWYVHTLAKTRNVLVSARILWSVFPTQGLLNIQNVPRSVFYPLLLIAMCQAKDTIFSCIHLDSAQWSKYYFVK